MPPTNTPRIDTQANEPQTNNSLTERDAPVLFNRHGRVFEAKINRPEALNALNAEVLRQLTDVLGTLDNDPTVGCFLITGSRRAFAAGADIKELRQQTYRSMSDSNFFEGWDRFAALRTPKVAAVSGYALGGGCELAMMCDVILASEDAKFGQPEIGLGLIPGMGGTQRLTRLIGRTKAMDLILTGRLMDASEALSSGLVSRVVPTENIATVAMSTASKIANFSKHTAMAARELVDRADHTTLAEGVLSERRTYYALFDTAEAHEGMDAFIDKREPNFRSR